MSGLERRIYRKELLGVLGYSMTWFRFKQKRGDIPKGQRDVENGREWFTDGQARDILATLNTPSPEIPPPERERAAP